MSNKKCDKCELLGFAFYSEAVMPCQYIEGNPNGTIWIIGLNPKGDLLTEQYPEERTVEDFAVFNPDSHPYFGDFKKVSEKLYANWMSENNTVAHTDLVKCSSQKFPPVINGVRVDRRNKIKIIENCKEYLLSQIKKHQPKVIICNGTDVCEVIMKSFPPCTSDPAERKMLTSYKATMKDDNGGNISFWVILSGFIGRIDDRNKRRLGKEIESILDCEEIKL